MMNTVRRINGRALSRSPPIIFDYPPPLPQRFKPPPAPKPKRSDVFTELMDGIKKITQQPDVLALLLLALIIVYDISHLDRLASFLGRKEAVKPFADWISSNKTQIAGLIILFPALYKFPQRSRWIAFGVAFLTIFAMAPQNLLVYLFISAGILLYWQIPRPEFRLFLLIVAGVYFYILFVETVPDPVPVTPPNPVPVVERRKG
ncbi:hypothetical protein [Beihai anemone virus 1]|uniref:hypothetical protein n=1 Tax=Beihai anemone virus 1 TaxID=1922352 RepID=UPI00090A3039|nr:hypothetical protein [Beihai anemone virus 1]APG77549.1 hypothetical protein [Beihai anemone virus 1]